MKIKFGPDAATVSRDLKRLALRISQWVLNAFVGVLLIQDLLSVEPITRVGVLKIALEVTVLAFALTASLLHSTISLIAKLQAVILPLTEAYEELSDRQGGVFGSQRSSHKIAAQMEGFVEKTIYFDGINRPFQTALKFGHGGDAKGSDLATVELAKVTADGNQIKIQRTQKRFRWIMSVIKYSNTSTSPTDRLIPADPNPEVQGQYVRYIHFQFLARVDNEAHEVTVRLRHPSGTWLKRGTTEEHASRRVRISLTTWEKVEGILGPVRADQRCYVSLDVMPGPVGDHQALSLRDLRIVELRQQR